MFARLSLYDDGSVLAKLQVRPTWTDQIKEKQLLDESLVPRFQQVKKGETLEFGLNREGVLCFRGRMCILNDSELRQSILREAHGSPYAMHPGGNKLYRDLRDMYWWPGLKREVIDYVRAVGRIICNWQNLRIATAINPTKLGECRILGPELVADTESKVKLIRERLKEAFDRQKSYADLKRKGIEYSVGDYVFLKRVGPVAYQLELPLELEKVHDIFHVSMLRRYHSDPSHVIPIEEIEVRPDLTIEEEPVQILKRNVKVLRKKSVSLVKVLWRNHGTEEATWEPEESMWH
ncbi:uncharacterized protein [Gossypium hirsutum]|uniref:DNA/RNA polymerases superfamily protein n=1 Tax=Gossypium hirsutum TaxID=3635 RepID=A0A1U8HNF5_GOSHI|nr:uncharacterized protein LOC107887847 [Gossypium hirsutum]